MSKEEELERRIAELEKRVEKLEQRPALISQYFPNPIIRAIGKPFGRSIGK